MFNNLVSRAQNHLDKRRRYNRAVTEIMSLSDRDVYDMRADRSQMLHEVKREIFG